MGQGLLIYEVSRSYITTHHSQYDPSGRVSSSSHRLLPAKNQTDRQTDMGVGFEPAISAEERPQTYALDRAATEDCN